MALEQLKKVLAIAIENAREGITISDPNLPDHPLIFANKGFLNMTGYSYEEVINRNCRFLHSHMRQQPGLEELRSAIKQKKATVVELQNIRRNGSLFWNRLSLTPVFEQDNLRYFIGIQEDITAIKEKAHLHQTLEEQQILAGVAAKAQEEERRHIGEELHDNINQLLATAKLYLNMAASQAGGHAALQQAKDYLDDAITEIRQLSTRLVRQPPPVQLGAQLDALVASLQPVVPFKLVLRNDLRNESGITPGIKLVLYRIVQEQLNNIVKYAKATEVSITLTAGNSRLTLVIGDDGVGFDPAEKTGGIGFTNMKNRLREYDGRLVIQTAPGAGCRIHVRVPAAGEAATEAPAETKAGLQHS